MLPQEADKLANLLIRQNAKLMKEIRYDAAIS